MLCYKSSLIFNKPSLQFCESRMLFYKCSMLFYKSSLSFSHIQSVILQIQYVILQIHSVILQIQNRFGAVRLDFLRFAGRYERVIIKAPTTSLISEPQPLQLFLSTILLCPTPPVLSPGVCIIINQVTCDVRLVLGRALIATSRVVFVACGFLLHEREDVDVGLGTAWRGGGGGGNSI